MNSFTHSSEENCGVFLNDGWGTVLDAQCTEALRDFKQLFTSGRPFRGAPCWFSFFFLYVVIYRPYPVTSRQASQQRVCICLPKYVFSRVCLVFSIQ
ncbi:hypothetical protein L873DRAFT_462382 [Choiromyces venosus 120613-1]|uniref:Uncharacterized protein n=1 Tax=Choiromyces venosus 120613-1 TaxID=1336337 RepID=A0A3N4JZR1_9PEZI|nr:hypothetical protein L873DRAFT_462382 [Choiromyces venosus 120613-1]